MLVSEIVRKIKSVKLFCLEQPLAKRIKEIRKREMKSIGRSFFYSTTVYFLNFLVKLSIFICLVSFSDDGNCFNARSVYVVILYCNMIASSVLKCWPRSLTNNREISHLIETIQEFFKSDDEVSTKFLSDNRISQHEGEEAADKFQETLKLLEIRVENEKHFNTPGILMRNVRLAARSQDTFELKCDYLELNEAKVYGVEGFKSSSLLQLFLGELEIDSGEIGINGKISFASNVPCIMSGTIRKNILCNEAFDGEKYKAILEVCKLEKDLEAIDAGDASLIDESTQNTILKVKINLARCFYQSADIYILDDPFEKLSFETSKLIFEKAKRLLKVASFSRFFKS